MAVLGKLLRRVRSSEHRSPLSGSDFAAPESIVVTSAAFARELAIRRVMCVAHPAAARIEPRGDPHRVELRDELSRLLEP